MNDFAWHGDKFEGILYRPHRGTLAQAMAEVRGFKDREALLDYLMQESREWNFPYQRHQIQFRDYCYDDRIDWPTVLVHVPGYGVLGFTNDGNITS